MFDRLRTAIGQLQSGISIDNCSKQQLVTAESTANATESHRGRRYLKLFLEQKNGTQTLSRQWETSGPLTTTNSARRRRFCLWRSFRLPASLRTSYQEIRMWLCQFRNCKQLLENRRDMSFSGCQKTSEWEAVHRHLRISWIRWNVTLPYQWFHSAEESEPAALYILSIMNILNFT